jgi:hypothetical protein
VLFDVDAPPRASLTQRSHQWVFVLPINPIVDGDGDRASSRRMPPLMCTRHRNSTVDRTAAVSPKREVQPACQDHLKERSR